MSCYRQDGPEARECVDKQGNIFWAHPSDAERPTPTPFFDSASNAARADADRLDRVYVELQHQLTLDPDHRDQLRRRGLSDVAIREHGFRTIHPAPVVRASIANSIAERFPYWQAVPGLYLSNGKARLAASQGLAIFGRDLAGHVVAVQVRRDTVEEGGSRYHWLSSAKHDGPSCGAPATYWRPLGTPVLPGTVRICEGSLKAVVAAEKTGVAGIAAGAGVGSMASDQIIAMLRELKPERVLFAPDADAHTQREVAHRVHSCLGKLLWLRQELGFELLVETWANDLAPEMRPKGIDDALAAGLPINLEDPEAYRRCLPFAEGPAGPAPEEVTVDDRHSADAGESATWPTPEPFEIRDESQLATPTWALPSSFRRMLRTVADAKQVTEEAVLASMLGILSAICAGRYSTRLAPQYQTFAHVWILLALRSSGGKSEALQVFQRDVYRAQKALQQQTQTDNDRNASERVSLIKEIAAMEAGGPEDYPGQLAECRERLRGVAEKPLPRFVWKDVSPQKLDVLYARYQRVGIVSPESADWISLVMGYGKDQGPTLGSCLSGFSVEPHGSDRITREESHCERPVLSLFLACQEADVRNFISDPVARRRGFLGRTLVVRGRSLVGNRLAYDCRPEIGPSDLLPWSALVDVVTAHTPPSDGDGWLPHDIPVADEAKALFSRLFEVVEKRLSVDSPDLQLDDLEDIVGRSLEQVGRLSVLLHVVWTASRRVQPTAEPLSEATVFRAFALMLWALQGFLELTSPTAAGGHNSALELWKAMDASPLFSRGFATLKDWTRLGPARWRSTGKVEPLLSVLESLGYVTVTTRRNARGPASRIIELNPSARHIDPKTAATVATVSENPLFIEVLRAHPHLRRFVSECDGMAEEPILAQPVANGRSQACTSITAEPCGFAHTGATVAGFPIHNQPVMVEIPEDLY